MASTNSNKGRAVVLSAACVTMFFISSIALYSVVSKNLLAVYPEWSSALTWAFPVFQTIMAVTGIFAGRISDKIGPRNVVIAAAVCYGLGWFMSGTVTDRGSSTCGSRSSPPSAMAWATTRRSPPAKSGSSTRRASPPASPLPPPPPAPPCCPRCSPRCSSESRHLWRPQGTRRHLLCNDRRLRPVPEGPRGRLAARGFEAPKGGAHAGTFGDLTPGEMVKTPRFWVLIVTFAFAATAGTLLVGKVASIAAVQLFADPTSAAAVALGGVVVSVNTCANLVGRLSFGQIIDKLGAYKSLLISLVVTIVALVIMSMSFTQSMFFVALALLGFSFGALLVIYPPLTGAPLAPATSVSTTASCSWAMPLLPGSASPSPPCCITPRPAALLPAVLLRRHRDRRHRRRAHRLHDGLRQQEEVRLVIPMWQRDSPFATFASHQH